MHPVHFSMQIKLKEITVGMESTKYIHINKCIKDE